MYSVTLSASENVRLGGLSKLVSRIVIQVVGSAWTGAIALKGIASGSGLGTGSQVEVAYTNRATKADVTDGTNITADGIYEVDAAGLEIYADYTHTSGSVTLYVNTIAG